jgi:serpin B
VKRLLPALLLPLALAAALPAVEPERSAPTETAAVVAGNNAFAFDLYAQLRKQEGNLFLSPYSISAALAMTSAGARGQTLDEMTNTLRLPQQDTLHPAFKALHTSLNDQRGGKRGYQLSTANALWGAKGYGFLPEFLKLTRDHYGAGLQEVNFGNAEEARATINAWVEKETHDKIKDLIPQGALNQSTRLVLTNAIYFKGDWLSQFKKDRTKDEPFFLADGKQVKTPLMHQKGTFHYADLGAFQALELPYAGKELSMLVLLPKKADGLAEMEKTMNADQLNAVLARLRPWNEIDLTLPKFKTTAAFGLNGELQALGMRQAFVPGAANFAGMNGREGDLYIALVVHKAFVDVNEEGTEAAAATAVITQNSSTAPPPPPPVFRADHPFVFVIRDNKTGSILFLGRLSNPSK